jgi:alpha-beta hydrolase superfamily lysophospholipase
MTAATGAAEAVSWSEPAGLAPRGTLIVIPGRGEQPDLYERFGRRIAADAYRVHVVADPVVSPDVTTSQVTAFAAAPDLVRPLVLAGSDTGALFAAGLVASGQVADADALVLAGLPVPAEQAPGAAAGGSPDAVWEEELQDRSTCPTHRGRLAELLVRRGALYDPVPDGWHEGADLAKVTPPVLGLHGADDQISPLSAVRARYAAAPRAELVSIAGSTHDALNNATHRTAAATVILFLERLRLGPDLAPIAVTETLEPGKL